MKVIEDPVTEDNIVHVRRPHYYEDLSVRFRLRIRSYESQFNNIYVTRLKEARGRLEKISLLRWEKPAQTLASLSGLKNTKCVIVGTLFKHQALKPSVLHEVSKEYQTVLPAFRTHFVSDTDELILEDETQRVSLSGKINVHRVVTGCVVAVLGKLLHNGIFEVEDFCWPVVEPISYLLPELENDIYLILISGTDVAINKNSLLLQLFIDWITGFTEINTNFLDISKIVHVIVAGNCIRSEPQEKPKYGAILDNSEDIEAVQELDYVLDQLVKFIDVDVMPGEFDPTTHTLPQQPFHKCMFPKAARFSTFRSVSNPYSCRIENRFILGTSGQPIDDVKRYTNLSDSLEILENSLQWAHLAPTAPDTLACYPFDDQDPFIIKEKPHIYFAGNQSKFQTKLISENEHDVRLVCIPSFVKTQSFVLINLKNLECQVINLNIHDFQESQPEECNR